jgi:hypothetical protein
MGQNGNINHMQPMVLVYKNKKMTDCDFGQGQMLDSIFQHHGAYG